MASGEGQSNPSSSGDAGGNHNEDYGNEYGPPLPTEDELREMEYCRLVGEATNMILNFAKDPKLAKYMTETAFQDVHAQWKATTTSPSKPDSKKQYSEKELEQEVEARLAQIFVAHKKGKKYGKKQRKSTDFPGYLVLPCFYVYSQNESHPSRGSRAVSALQITEHAETAERNELHRGEETWEGEEYEHDRALSADRTYLKFKKRLDCYPEQCFRYCFKGNPLWASKEGAEPGVCSQCGGPRVYEMQLMPPLLYYLQQACKDLPSTAYSPNDWEWLTLIIFTCAQLVVQKLDDLLFNRVLDWQGNVKLITMRSIVSRIGPFML
ncbi:hypothetical protein L7F22_027582 [Adiantum nelumboides]|nr:hypothetical protein [Adiantum nelumboides]